MEKDFAFQWHITDLCNLRCRHCYQDRFDKEQDISIKEWERIIHNITTTLSKNNYRGLGVNLTGGEPLVSNLFYPIMNILEETPIVKNINIITNAINLDAHISDLQSYNKIGHLKISLEGGTEETNDIIRGKGNFQKVLKNLENLNLDFLLMFTLAKYNCSELDEIFSLAKNVSADGIILERFIPLGVGRAIWQSVPDNNDWYEVLLTVSQWGGCEPEDLIPYKAFYINLKWNKILGALCNLGDEAMALMPNGDVYPCRRLPIVIGNLIRDDFSGILDRLKIFREQFDKEKLQGRCFNCPEDDCIGCRALAYALTNNIFAEDKQCPLWKLQIEEK